MLDRPATLPGVDRSLYSTPAEALPFSASGPSLLITATGDYSYITLPWH
jgi:hypothetical protein